MVSGDDEHRPQLERRVPEAAPLRQFFQEQWDLLQGLVEGWQRRKLGEQAQRQLLTDAVEAIVDGTDRRLRGLSSYQSQLRQSARGLLVYIEGLVSQMPPPLLVSKQTLVMDPTVGRLFQDAYQVEGLLQEGRALERFLASRIDDCREVFALVSLFKTEKQVFGSELQGEILVSDVMQTIVGFVGHKVIALEATEAALRSALKRTLFDSVVGHLRLETVRLRHHRSGEDERRDALLAGRNPDDPAVYLDMLRGLLRSPERLLVLRSQQLTLSKLGIKVAGQADRGLTSSTDTLDFRELSVGDNQTRILCMTRHPLLAGGALGGT